MGQAGRRNRKRGMWQRGVEGRQTLQYSWLALYVSHKLAGELPLSDSLTEHTLFPARIVSSLYLFPSRSYSLSLSLHSPISLVFSSFPLPTSSSFPKIKVYKLTRVCTCVGGTRVWIRCSQRRLGKQKCRWDSGENGGKIVGSEETERSKKERM